MTTAVSAILTTTTSACNHIDEDKPTSFAFRGGRRELFRHLIQVGILNEQGELLDKQIALPSLTSTHQQRLTPFLERPEIQTVDQLECRIVSKALIGGAAAYVVQPSEIFEEMLKEWDITLEQPLERAPAPYDVDFRFMLEPTLSFEELETLREKFPALLKASAYSNICHVYDRAGQEESYNHLFIFSLGQPNVDITFATKLRRDHLFVRDNIRVEYKSGWELVCTPQAIVDYALGLIRIEGMIDRQGWAMLAVRLSKGDVFVGDVAKIKESFNLPKDIQKCASNHRVSQSELYYRLYKWFPSSISHCPTEKNLYGAAVSLLKQGYSYPVVSSALELVLFLRGEREGFQDLELMDFPTEFGDYLPEKLRSISGLYCHKEAEEWCGSKSQHKKKIGMHFCLNMPLTVGFLKKLPGLYKEKILEKAAVCQNLDIELANDEKELCKNLLFKLLDDPTTHTLAKELWKVWEEQFKGTVRVSLLLKLGDEFLEDNLKFLTYPQRQQIWVKGQTRSLKLAVACLSKKKIEIIPEFAEALKSALQSQIDTWGILQLAFQCELWEVSQLSAIWMNQCRLQCSLALWVEGHEKNILDGLEEESFIRERIPHSNPNELLDVVRQYLNTPTLIQELKEAYLQQLSPLEAIRYLEGQQEPVSRSLIKKLCETSPSSGVDYLLKYWEVDDYVETFAMKASDTILVKLLEKYIPSDACAERVFKDGKKNTAMEVLNHLILKRPSSPFILEGIKSYFPLPSKVLASVRLQQSSLFEHHCPKKLVELFHTHAIAVEYSPSIASKILLALPDETQLRKAFQVGLLTDGPIKETLQTLIRERKFDLCGFWLEKFCDEEIVTLLSTSKQLKLCHHFFRANPSSFMPYFSEVETEFATSMLLKHFYPADKVLRQLYLWADNQKLIGPCVEIYKKYALNDQTLLLILCKKTQTEHTHKKQLLSLLISEECLLESLRFMQSECWKYWSTYEKVNKEALFAAVATIEFTDYSLCLDLYKTYKHIFFLSHLLKCPQEKIAKLAFKDYTFQNECEDSILHFIDHLAKFKLTEEEIQKILEVFEKVESEPARSFKAFASCSDKRLLFLAFQILKAHPRNLDKELVYKILKFWLLEDESTIDFITAHVDELNLDTHHYNALKSQVIFFTLKNTPLESIEPVLNMLHTYVRNKHIIQDAELKKSCLLKATDLHCLLLTKFFDSSNFKLFIPFLFGTERQRETEENPLTLPEDFSKIHYEMILRSCYNLSTNYRGHFLVSYFDHLIKFYNRDTLALIKVVDNLLYGYSMECLFDFEKHLDFCKSVLDLFKTSAFIKKFGPAKEYEYTLYLFVMPWVVYMNGNYSPNLCEQEVIQEQLIRKILNQVSIDAFHHALAIMEKVQQNSLINKPQKLLELYFIFFSFARVYATEENVYEILLRLLDVMTPEKAFVGLLANKPLDPAIFKLLQEFLNLTLDLASKYPSIQLSGLLYKVLYFPHTVEVLTFDPHFYVAYIKQIIPILAKTPPPEILSLDQDPIFSLCAGLKHTINVTDHILMWMRALLEQQPSTAVPHVTKILSHTIHVWKVFHPQAAVLKDIFETLKITQAPESLVMPSYSSEYTKIVFKRG